MIKVLMQRRVPPGFDTDDDEQLARHARIAADALATIGGGAHWITSYIADDTIFSVVVFPSEADVERFRQAAGITDQTSVVRRISRTFDASFADAPLRRP
ncbi:MAG: hypothetical protein WC729_20895 [Sphingomonas sp.]|jgi:hypothetical protein|uniref:hypothetical protein n=1 Tax=Sphingomonas sp. TaxID=28214 RepID=UPI003563A8D8